jgi:ketosteroid isomerase-like protein
VSLEREEAMRSRKILAAVLFLVIGSRFASGQEAKGAAGEPDVKGMMRRTVEAWQTMDPAKAAPLYAKDATLAFYDIAPLKFTGWTEYAQGAAQTFAGFSSLKLTLNHDLRTERRGDVAWATTTFRADIVNKDGSKVALDGRWTLIWERRGAEWLIVHEHGSVPLAVPAPAAQKTNFD